MKSTSKAAVMALIITAGSYPVPALADSLVYKNARFGFQITLPDGAGVVGDDLKTINWSPTNISDATDGASFEADNSHIQLLTFGGYFVQDSWADVYRSVEKGIRADGGSISYKRITDDWFVYSGTTANGRIFYRRTERAHDCMGDAITITARITYSKEAQWMSGLIAPMMATLKGC